MNNESHAAIFPSANEYWLRRKIKASLVDCIPVEMDVADEFKRALGAIELARGRPALLYAGNLVSTQASPHISISNFDELPFAEMVDAVPANIRDVDVIVVTPGGSAQTVSYFVDKLRSRFDCVGFLIPYACMSAGTILVLSGDEIWMDERSYLGPIDPQVLGREGRFVPLQALWVLLKKIQEDGQKALSQGGQPAWTHVQLLRNMDAKELGDALSASRYASQLAASYLENWKFRNWSTRQTSGQAVTEMSSVTSKLATLKELGWSDELIDSMIAADEILNIVDRLEPTSASDCQVVDSSGLELTLSQAVTVGSREIDLT